MKLELPLEDARAAGCGFRLGDVPGGLQRDGKSGVRKRVVWREHGEGECRGNGLLKPAAVAQGADKAVMGLDAG